MSILTISQWFTSWSLLTSSSSTCLRIWNGLFGFRSTIITYIWPFAWSFHLLLLSTIWRITIYLFVVIHILHTRWMLLATIKLTVGHITDTLQMVRFVWFILKFTWFDWSDIIVLKVMGITSRSCSLGF